jgi:hypothetical protein
VIVLREVAMIRRGLLAALTISVTLGATPALARERWVPAIQTTQEWNAFPCTSYVITNVCSVDKEFDGPGSLPPTIRVGDTVRYTNKKGQAVEFRVRSISFFVYGKDLDSTWGGKRYTAKKGDTQCSLYDVSPRSDLDYVSKITVKGCRLLQE